MKPQPWFTGIYKVKRNGSDSTPMMCGRAVQSKRRNELCRKVQYLCRRSGCAERMRKKCVCVQLNCSLSHCNSIQSVTDTKQIMSPKTTPPHHTLRNRHVLLFPFTQYIDQQKKSTIQGTAFLHNIWIAAGKEHDNIESSSFFPLSTFPIKLLHFLSLTIFPSNCCLCQLELNNWEG